MIIFNQKEGVMTATCDDIDCQRTETFTGADWDDCYEQAVEDGWQSTKDGGQWVHYCSSH